MNECKISEVISLVEDIAEMHQSHFIGYDYKKDLEDAYQKLRGILKEDSVGTFKRNVQNNTCCREGGICGCAVGYCKGKLS